MSVPSLELGLSHPLSRKRLRSPPPNQRRGTYLPATKGVGESQFRRLERKLSTLSTQCFIRYISLSIIKF